jgi:hypothetical protein
MNKPGLFVVISILAIALSSSAAAHEEGIYESLEHIHLGRVFLSPAERTYLDKHRGVPAPVATSSGTGQRSSAARNNNAAGYIVSSSGRAHVWKNGDFVSTKIPDSVRFPGDVKVKRTADGPAARNDTPGVDEATPVTGAADDGD